MSTGATDEQIEAAVLAFIDEWNNVINPRTGRRYRAPWSGRLWHRFMRAAMDEVVKPGQVIVDAERVPTDDELAAIEALTNVVFERLGAIPEWRAVVTYLERQR